jgi:hypothetical protein
MFFIHKLQKRALSKILTDRKVEFMPLENVKSVCFIFDIEEERIFEAIKFLTDMLRSKNINYRGLAINLKNKVFPDLVLDYQIRLINKKDISFIGTPNYNLINKFVNEKTDLFIDLSSEYCYTHDFIARSSLASFKVGRLNYSNHPYDLQIESKSIEKSAPIDFLKQVFHYLTKIKSDI